MLKMSFLGKIYSISVRRILIGPSNTVRMISQQRPMSSKAEETDAEFDARYVAYFNRPDIDGWEVILPVHLVKIQ